MRKALLGTLLVAGGLWALGCGDDRTPLPTMPPQFAHSPEHDLELKIEALFPEDKGKKKGGGLRNAALKRLRNIKNKVDTKLKPAQDMAVALAVFGVEHLNNGDLIPSSMAQPYPMPPFSSPLLSTEDALAELIEELFTFVGLDAIVAAVPPEGKLVVVTDDQDRPLALADFPNGWTDQQGVVVTIKCNTSAFPPGQGPLGTTLRQFPLFCFYDVSDKETVEPFLKDVRVAACQVDDIIPGQEPFHDFDRDKLVLGAGATPATFRLLPPAPSTGLGLCPGVTAPIASIGPEGPTLAHAGWRALVARLSPLTARLLSPRPLHASAVVVKDNGLGGLTDGFTPINAVEPFTIEQGEALFENVIPLVGTQTIEDFYAYNDEGGFVASSNTQLTLGAGQLEKSNNSILFLYQDQNGDVSLVMIHDKPGDGSGGKAVFDFSGVPGGTSFLVRDDPAGSEAVLNTSTWRWANCCTDGGALGFLNSGFTITITPDFPTSGGLSAGKIDTWEFLTGSLASPTAIILDRTLDITIKRPSGP